MSRLSFYPDVSVIVPVFNTEKYLDAAVQSVLAQTYRQWELLLIDDGSEDGSGNICDRYAAQDRRVRVIHTDNRGYGCARNTGLRHASGQWIMFLDSDDSLAPQALECLLNHAGHADLVMALYQTVPRPTIKDTAVPGGRFETAAELETLFPDLYEPYFFLSVTAKLYRRSLLGDGFAVQEGQMVSEWLFNIRILPACRGICFVPESVYYYRLTSQASVCWRFHSDWLFVSRRVYDAVVSLFPGSAPVRAFMAKRYTYRVGQHLAAIALLRNAGRLQKLAMIKAERADPFYLQEEISRAGCGKKYSAVWKAFMDGRAELALEEAERSVHETV